MAGAYSDDDGGSKSGSVYVFHSKTPTSAPTISYMPTAIPTPEPTAAPTTAVPTISTPPSPVPTPLCGHLVPLAPGSIECPDNPDLPNCEDVGCGELCEGDGECGTDNHLNNCDSKVNTDWGFDMYRKHCVLPTPSPTTLAPTLVPTTTPWPTFTRLPTPVPSPICGYLVPIDPSECPGAPNPSRFDLDLPNCEDVGCGEVRSWW